MGGIILILKGFYPPSKLTSSKLTFRAWSGCCQWDWGIIKGCSGLGIAQGVSSVLKTGWEYGELSKDLKQALKPLSLPCISEVNCTPGSVAGISPLQSPTEAQKMVMPVKHCLGCRDAECLWDVYMEAQLPGKKGEVFLQKCLCLREHSSAIS